MARLAAWPRNPRLRWTIVGLIAMIAVVVGGTDAFLLAWAGTADDVAIEDVISEFRRDTGAAPLATSSPTAAPTDAASPTPEATTSEAGPVRGAPSASPAPSAGPATPSPTPTPTPAGPHLPRPAPGVYVYDTTGGESITMPGGSRSYPDETFGVVRHQSGCNWTLERRILEQHNETAELCTREGKLLQPVFETTIEFFGQRETERLECDPPQVYADVTLEPGATWTGRCSGEGVNSHSTTTYVGRESLVVEGVAIETMHIRVIGETSGDAEGTSRADIWTSVEHGMIIKVDRESTSKTDRFGAGITYQESATFVLQSLTPRS